MNDQWRSKDLAKIHIAKSQLGLSDEDYRAVLSNLCGVESAAKLDKRGRFKVLKHFESLGWNARTRKAHQRVAPSLPQDKKIRALWLDMHSQGIIRNPQESALRSYVRRMTGCERLEWITNQQASQVIEALKKWRHRSKEAPHGK